MKDHFIKLFKYDRFASEQILEAILKAGNPEKPRQLMAHLLAAQKVWFNRCNNLPAFTGGLWPDWQPDTFAGMIAANSTDWINSLEELQPSDFERTVSYKTFKGDSYQNILSDVLAHVINHGTHHRAQAGQHLITAGIGSLPPTDYIFYIR